MKGKSYLFYKIHCIFSDCVDLLSVNLILSDTFQEPENKIINPILSLF